MKLPYVHPFALSGIDLFEETCVKFAACRPLISRIHHNVDNVRLVICPLALYTSVLFAFLNPYVWLHATHRQLQQEKKIADQYHGRGGGRDLALSTRS